MAKAPAKDPFRCVECGWSATKWVGRCGECQAWGTVEEIAAPKKLSLVAGSITSAAKPIGDFVHHHPSIKVLALSFLMIVGFVLIAESLDVHIPKGYVYFAMAFSLGVEVLNIRARQKKGG